MKILSVVIAGGDGKRMFPVSKHDAPKQFLKLQKFELSFFQMAVKRAKMFSNDILIIGNKLHEKIINDQLKKINIKDVYIIYEPVKKNTLYPCIIGCLYSQSVLKYDYTFIFPSDHVMDDVKFFDIFNEVRSEIKNSLYLFGIKPNNPSSLYGYIKALNDNMLSDVSDFYEKPDQKKAKELIKDSYFWNSGIFLFHNRTFLNSVPKNVVDLFTGFIHDQESSFFYSLPNLCVNKAILEVSKNLTIVQLSGVFWSDCGSFEFYDHLFSEPCYKVKCSDVFETSIVEKFLVYICMDFFYIGDLDNSFSLSLFFNKVFLQNSFVKKMLFDFGTEACYSNQTYVIKKIQLKPFSVFNYVSDKKVFILKSLGRCILRTKSLSFDMRDKVILCETSFFVKSFDEVCEFYLFSV